MVLPLTAKINKSNHLEIGGCDLVDLAKEYLTPLFVYDKDDISSQCNLYLDSFSHRSLETQVVYASKAFSCLAICQLVNQEGLGIDVSSAGELYVALKAGFDGKKVFLHGNNKTESELRMALDAKVGRIVVDSFNEMELLSQLLDKRQMNQSIMIRITPGIKPSTHQYIQTGQVDSKFGFDIDSGLAKQAVKRALALPHLDLKGFHVHIGSQIFSLHSYRRVIEVIFAFAKEVSNELDFKLEELNLGGGLGIKYVATDQPSSIQDYGKVICDNVISQAKSLKMPIPKIIVEPGRSIVGRAGVTLYRVGTIKKVPKFKNYVAVNGGMSDNLRPMLYGSSYQALLANKAGSQLKEEVTIVGHHCESGDVLVKDVMLPDVEVGDLVCTPATGAYGYVLANNYNKQTKPAVILVSKGKARLIIRRETYEDLVRLDEPLT